MADSAIGGDRGDEDDWDEIVQLEQAGNMSRPANILDCIMTCVHAHGAQHTYSDFCCCYCPHKEYPVHKHGQARSHDRSSADFRG